MSIRAFELAVAYAQQCRTFGKPIAEHQAIAFKLAEMATKGRSCPPAPFLLVGESTSEIQKTIISRGLLKKDPVTS